MGKKLVLYVKRYYFKQIASGQKEIDYRPATPYWMKKLEGKSFDSIEIICGPDVIERPWRGVARSIMLYNEVQQSVYSIYLTARRK